MTKPEDLSPAPRGNGGQPWLPRSLLWQTFLLIALVLILSLTVWSAIFRHFHEPGRARDLAQMAASVVNLTRTALINAETSRRTDLLIDLAALEGIRIYPSEPTDEILPLPETRPMQLLTREIKNQLGEHTRLAARWKTLDGFWISFRLDPEDPDDFWVRLPAERLESSGTADWLGWVFAAFSVSLLGAFLIVSRISTPLRSLADAAKMVGRGRTPPPLPENGPQEFAIVSRAFNQMAGDLARNEAERAVILAGVSHDLRTPLARLRLGIEMSGSPDEDIVPMIADIEEMDRIIGQFLDFGRGEPHTPTEPIDLAALVTDVAEPYRLRGVDLNIDTPVRLTVSARALPLRRAIANLIDNAIRYAPDTPIDVRVHADRAEAHVEVLDRGPGIPPDQIDRLRQPFTRLEAARSDTKGAGLGLAIIDRVMRSHDGRLELLEREGGGLRAVLSLPLRKQRARMRAVANAQDKQ
ncbi:ATP-binding protein [Pseudazoarcus pumilus]|uniref:ATP-binding protein n=1 Tax=Pseudazoarcus pumilus TaxID=2067960 RepID=UPI001D178FD0|nr:ATP-binding protein [Pseudazoarcus pumilus]